MRFYNKGFSLIELSVVLVIMGVIGAGVLAAAVVEIEASRLKETKEKLNKIEASIQLYYEVNGRMPCPASGALSTGAGTEVTYNTATTPDTCTTSSPGTEDNHETYSGIVPTRTLNLADDYLVDGWDNRFSYVVSKNCIEPTYWLTLSSTTVASTSSPFGCNASITPTPTIGGAITIQDVADNPRNPNAVYVVISHGRNKIGAWGNNGGAARITTNPISQGDDEPENNDFTSDATYVDDSILDFNTAGTAYFDDIVRWKTGPQIQYDKQN